MSLVHRAAESGSAALAEAEPMPSYAVVAVHEPAPAAPASPGARVDEHAFPGVRSMVLLDVDGNVVASSVDTLLGRDFSNRDYFRKARDGHSAQTLYVAPPLKTC